ncbi:protein kinase domain-containing protein [Corallococcus terminator]
MAPSGRDEPLLAPTVASVAPTPAPVSTSETPPAEASPSALATPDALPPRDWARYELFELLGRGGMGEVYRAKDRRLSRQVALKFIRGADPERALRLLQEARAQARIDHPHVCKVFEVGEVAGRAYIAMQLVEGELLDAAARHLSVREKVRLMKDVAEAIHEAHRLGVIHRDLKPSNIMVVRTEGGGWAPVIMDFGLAYEAERGHGLTVSGAVMGTPAYMAPEQARGDVRGIDHRGDVYGLGATLHELLTGAPPFTGATRMETLSKVLHDEPPPLRSRVPTLDVALETLCLKCLHKEPGQRYASAQALADDLRRYLDGEPILGRRPGPLHRLRRATRGQRALVSLTCVSLVGALLLAGFGARTWLAQRELRAQTDARVRLAERLGQQVQELEAFVRAFQALPLHDTRPELRLAHERLEKLSARGQGLGPPEEGLVLQALGRGHLALREFEQAHQALARARELGVDSPGLHYALGRALGERYRLALEDARRGGGAGWVASQQPLLAARYLVPALQSLERSRGLELESPRYLEALIALYREDHVLAEEAAREAMAQAPWLSEARKLAGDVSLARAMSLLERGDYGGARAGLREAGARYEQALELGRSDAWSHEALAEVWLQLSELDKREGRSRKASLDLAEAAVDKSLTAAPDRAAGHTKKAQVLMNQYRAVNFQGEPDARDAQALLTAWMAAAERAVELNPRDVLAHDSLGYGHFMTGLRRARAGQPPEASFDAALRWLSRAIELQPLYPWALNDLGLVHRWRGNHQREHGQDPLPAYEAAARAFLEATRADPRYLFAHSNLAELHAAMASHRLSRGLAPEADVQLALEASERALAVDDRFHSAHEHAASAELTRARHLLDTGGDPGPALERALRSAARARELNARSDRAPFHQADAHLLQALHALREGRDATKPLAAGRLALAEASRLSPSCADCRSLGAELALAAADQQRRDGRVGRASLRGALAEARRAVALYPYPESHLTLARACWRWAQAAADTAAPAVVDEGLTQVDLALRRDPDWAEARAVRGALLLTRARTLERGPAWTQALHEAHAALTLATQRVPWLRSTYAEPLRDAEAALGRLPPERSAR